MSTFFNLLSFLFFFFFFWEKRASSFHARHAVFATSCLRHFGVSVYCFLFLYFSYTNGLGCGKLKCFNSSRVTWCWRCFFWLSVGVEYGLECKAVAGSPAVSELQIRKHLKLRFEKAQPTTNKKAKNVTYFGHEKVLGDTQTHTQSGIEFTVVCKRFYDCVCCAMDRCKRCGFCENVQANGDFM